MIRLIILGAPGSGKGSQCKWITKDYSVPSAIFFLKISPVEICGTL